MFIRQLIKSIKQCTHTHTHTHTHPQEAIHPWLRHTARHVAKGEMDMAEGS